MLFDNIIEMMYNNTMKTKTQTITRNGPNLTATMTKTKTRSDGTVKVKKVVDENYNNPALARRYTTKTKTKAVGY